MGPKVVSGDKKLFTPGPLTTSPGVKNAMLRDMGSRDAEFIATIQSIRQGLLKVSVTSVVELELAELKQYYETHDFM